MPYEKKFQLITPMDIIYCFHRFEEIIMPAYLKYRMDSGLLEDDLRVLTLKYIQVYHLEKIYHLSIISEGLLKGNEAEWWENVFPRYKQFIKFVDDDPIKRNIRYGGRMMNSVRMDYLNGLFTIMESTIRRFTREIGIVDSKGRVNRRGVGSTNKLFSIFFRNLDLETDAEGFFLMLTLRNLSHNDGVYITGNDAVSLPFHGKSYDFKDGDISQLMDIKFYEELITDNINFMIKFLHHEKILSLPFLTDIKTDHKVVLVD